MTVAKHSRGGPTKDEVKCGMSGVLRRLVEGWQAHQADESILRRVQKFLISGDGAHQAKGRLIRLLELAASYNDKGIYWRNDSPAQVQQTRQEWQQEIDALVGLLGDSSLPADLRAALCSGAAVGDDSGRYVERARRWLAEGR